LIRMSNRRGIAPWLEGLTFGAIDIGPQRTREVTLGFFDVHAHRDIAPWTEERLYTSQFRLRLTDRVTELTIDVPVLS